MESNWRARVYTEGLLHANATLAARILSGPHAGKYLLNDKYLGQVHIVYTAGFPASWFMTSITAAVGDLRFPYGYDVEPD